MSIEEDEDENNVYVVSKLFFFCYGLGMILILCFLFGNCWVYKFGLKNNELMMLEGDLIWLFYFGFLVNYLVLVGGGEIFMFDYYGMKVKMLIKLGEIIDIVEIEFFYLFGFCVIVDDNFIVCLVDIDDCVILIDSVRGFVKINCDG